LSVVPGLASEIICTFVATRFWRVAALERISLALDAIWHVQMPEARNEFREDKNQAGGKKDSAFAVLNA